MWVIVCCVIGVFKVQWIVWVVIGGFQDFVCSFVVLFNWDICLVYFNVVWIVGDVWRYYGIGWQLVSLEDFFGDEFMVNCYIQCIVYLWIFELVQCCIQGEIDCIYEWMYVDIFRNFMLQEFELLVWEFYVQVEFVIMDMMVCCVVVYCWIEEDFVKIDIFVVVEVFIVYQVDIVVCLLVGEMECIIGLDVFWVNLFIVILFDNM